MSIKNPSKYFLKYLADFCTVLVELIIKCIIKEKDSFKVDSFNVLFYDDLHKALTQIINETNSYKLPICTNISNEIYGYVEVFAGLNKNDIKSTVDIEFEMDCNEKSYNKDSLEMRYIVMNDKENSEKLK